MLKNYFCTMLFIAGTTTVPLYSMATTMGGGTAEQMALLQQ